MFFLKMYSDIESSTVATIEFLLFEVFSTTGAKVECPGLRPSTLLDETVTFAGVQRVFPGDGI